MIDVTEPKNDAVGMEKELIAPEPVIHRALKEKDSQQNREMRRARKRNLRRRFAEIERTARPIDRCCHCCREKQNQQEQISPIFQERQHKNVKADVTVKVRLFEPERHTIERLQINVPTPGFALCREERQYRRTAHHHQMPWHAVAERADELRQVYLDHFFGSAHDPQAFAL